MVNEGHEMKVPDDYEPIAPEEDVEDCDVSKPLLGDEAEEIFFDGKARDLNSLLKTDEFRDFCK